MTYDLFVTGTTEYHLFSGPRAGLSTVFRVFFSAWQPVVVDSHIQRVVLETEETTATQRVSPRSIKYQSRLRSQRVTKVNGSHYGYSPLLESTGIQIATKSLPGPTNRERRKLIGVKTMPLGTNYSFYCCIWSAASIRNLNY